MTHPLASRSGVPLDRNHLCLLIEPRAKYGFANQLAKHEVQHQSTVDFTRTRQGDEEEKEEVKTTLILPLAVWP